MRGLPGSMTAMLFTLPLWFLKGSTAFFTRLTRRTYKAQLVSACRWAIFDT